MLVVVVVHHRLVLRLVFLFVVGRPLLLLLVFVTDGDVAYDCDGDDDELHVHHHHVRAY